jgi:hypothetical protein
VFRLVSITNASAVAASDCANLLHKRLLLGALGPVAGQPRQIAAASPGALYAVLDFPR